MAKARICKKKRFSLLNMKWSFVFGASKAFWMSLKFSTLLNLKRGENFSNFSAKPGDSKLSTRNEIIQLDFFFQLDWILTWLVFEVNQTFNFNQFEFKNVISFLWFPSLALKNSYSALKYFFLAACISTCKSSFENCLKLPILSSLKISRSIGLFSPEEA